MGFWKYVKDIFFCKPEEVYEYEKGFYRWAFGTDKELSNMQQLTHWNAIHGDKFTITTGNLIRTDIERMQSLYLKHLDEKSNNYAT